METLNLIWNYTLNNTAFVFAIIYWILMLYFQYKYYKADREKTKLQILLNDTLKITEVSVKAGIELWKRYKKLQETLKEVRTKRDKTYNKHGTQIAYFKKRVLAYKIAIKNTFIHAPQFITLLQEEFYEISKKSLTKIRKLEKSLDKKGENK